MIARTWEIVEAFGSYGFCKAHAVAFAVPTYQSAWLKAHHPAAFYAGLLTHDPGMYPKRLLLADARRRGVPVLPLDVNRSAVAHRIELVSAVAWGLRLALSDVHGISEAESGADRGRAARTPRCSTSGSGPGRAVRSPNGSPRSARWTRSAPTGATCCCTCPSCTGRAPGRWRSTPAGRRRGGRPVRDCPTWTTRNGSAPNWASSAWTPPAT